MAPSVWSSTFGLCGAIPSSPTWLWRNKIWRDARGFSLLEVVVAAIIILISLLAAGRLFHQQTRESVRIQNLSSANQIEREIRSAVGVQAKNYFAAAAGSAACKDSGANVFANLFTSALPSGITLVPLASPGTLDAATQTFNALTHVQPPPTDTDPLWARQHQALIRCKAQTPFTSGFPLNSSIYFCLQIFPPANPPLQITDILYSAPAFAEFTLIPSDMALNTPLTCKQMTTGNYALPSNAQRLVWTLYYTIYWNRDDVGGRVFGDYVGFYAMGD